VTRIPSPIRGIPRNLGDHLVRTCGVSRASDEALLAGIAAGDPAAARALVRRHQQRVFGLALAILGDHHAAEDTAQETFVRVWRRADSFDPRRASAVTWLLAITRNAAIDARRVRIASPVDPQDLLFAQLATGTDPQDRALFGADVERVRDALVDLPRPQRDALLLAAYLGLTANEVADAQQVPLGTAKTRIRDGLRKLRAQLYDEERTT
jgi:RNA polymerase sigma factor (sigma-70 family)